MSKQSTMKPLAVALGAAFVTSLATTPVANAAENPFALSELSSGYMVAGSHAKEGKCGEGKCGEGKCGGKATSEATSETTSETKTTEGKCGEGKCGGDKAGAEAKTTEGKCGEGKCGGMK